MEHFANVKELNQSSARDKAARAVFTASAFFSVVAVAGIVFFIMLESLPAFSEIGALNFIFGTTWAPTKDFLPVVREIRNPAHDSRESGRYRGSDAWSAEPWECLPPYFSLIFAPRD